MARSKSLLAGSLCVLSGLMISHAPIMQAHDARSMSVYTVLINEGSKRDDVVAAIRRAGGTITAENAALGAWRVTGPRLGFAAAVATSPAILGAAADQPIGRIASERPLAGLARELFSRPAAFTETTAPGPAPTAALDPLDAGQWGLRMVKSDLARRVQAGRRKVLVGILSTGVDRTHLELADNLDAQLSINLVSDMARDETGTPVDGPCEVVGCRDAAGTDDSGFGTHLAGIVAARANGFGLSGVAPNVTLVDIRVAQDSGFTFLWPVIDGLMYAANAGVDVALLGFTIDPWIYHCEDNPGDSPEAQAAQRLAIAALTRALNYAHRHGVTVIGQMGNQHSDLGTPQPDTNSPTFPFNTDYTRTLDNATCFQLPVEGAHVIGVSALGPSEKKADYSNYGVERTLVSGPGGWFRDFFGTPQFRVNQNLVLSTYPLNVGVAEGNIDAAGNVTAQGNALGVQKACGPGGCAFYQYLQGSAMAAAHAAGVAALIVSEYGQPDGEGGWTMPPNHVQRVLLNTARAHACPAPPTQDYLNEGRDPSFTATCVGDQNFNGFYGHGIVNANRAVREGRQFLP